MEKQWLLVLICGCILAAALLSTGAGSNSESSSPDSDVSTEKRLRTQVPGAVPVDTKIPPVPTAAATEAMASEATTTSTFTTTKEFPDKHIYVNKDMDRYHLHHDGSTLPRVLVYTWCTEDTFTMFVNEVYWKCCYAHAHGFDVVFSDKKNFTGVAEYDMPPQFASESHHGRLDNWYSEENMWALWDDIKPYLKSGKYDYVFMMGADVEILQEWLHWPVWAYDTADYDISIMDQHHFPILYSYGLNENNVLFKATDFALQFIDEVFEYRKGFHLQGDNGPYMENILTFLGREAEAEGREGYSKKCFKYVKLWKPSLLCFKDKNWTKQNDDYEDCFFREVERMAGPFGYRKSKHFGFYPNYIEHPVGTPWFPEHFKRGEAPEVPSTHYQAAGLPLGPWVNCWSSVREWWPSPGKNCFAYHWNGPKDPNKLGKVRGTCPDPSFNWDRSQYNPKNRHSKKKKDR